MSLQFQQQDFSHILAPQTHQMSLHVFPQYSQTTQRPTPTPARKHRDPMEEMLDAWLQTQELYKEYPPEKGYRIGIGKGKFVITQMVPVDPMYVMRERWKQALELYETYPPEEGYRIGIGHKGEFVITKFPKERELTIAGVADFDISELSPEAYHAYQVGLASQIRLQQQVIGHTYTPISQEPKVVLTEVGVTPVTKIEPVQEPLGTTQTLLNWEHEFFRQTKWREELAEKYPAPKYKVVWSPRGAAIYKTVAEPEEVKAKSWDEWFGEAVSGLGTRFKEAFAPQLPTMIQPPEPTTWKLLKQVHTSQEWLGRIPVESTTIPVFEREFGGLDKPKLVFKEYDLGVQFAQMLEPVKLPAGVISEIETVAYGTPTVSGATVQTIASIFTGRPTVTLLQEYYEVMGPWGTVGGLIGTYMIGKGFAAVGSEVWRGTKWVGAKVSQYVKGTAFYEYVLEPGVRVGKESFVQYGLEPAYRGIQTYGWEPLRRGLIAYGYEPLKREFVYPTISLAKEFQIYGRSVLWPQVREAITGYGVSPIKRTYIDPTAQLFRDYMTPAWSLAQETKLYGKAVLLPQIKETLYRYGITPIKRDILEPTKTEISRLFGMDFWRELKYGWKIKAWRIHYVPSETPLRGITLTRGITGLPYRGLMGPTAKSVAHVTSQELILLSKYASAQAIKQTGKAFAKTVFGVGAAALVQTITPQKQKRKQKKALTILHAWTGPQYPSIYEMEQEWGELELEPYPTVTFEPFAKEKAKPKQVSAQRFEQFSVPRLEPFEIPSFEEAAVSMTQQAQRIRQVQKQVQKQIQKQETAKPYRLKFEFAKPKKRKGKDLWGAWFKRKRHIKTPEQMIKTYMEMKMPKIGGKQK